jgi:hypothetical protein
MGPSSGWRVPAVWRLRAHRRQRMHACSGWLQIAQPAEIRVFAVGMPAGRTNSSFYAGVRGGLRASRHQAPNMLG